MTEARGMHLGCPMVSSDSPQVLWRSHSTNIRKSNMQSFSEILNIYKEKKKKKKESVAASDIFIASRVHWADGKDRKQRSMQKHRAKRLEAEEHDNPAPLNYQRHLLALLPSLLPKSRQPFISFSSMLERLFPQSLSKRLFKQVPWNLRQILTVVPVQERQPILLIFLPFLLPAWPAFPIFVELLNCEL